MSGSKDYNERKQITNKIRGGKITLFREFEKDFIPKEWVRDVSERYDRYKDIESNRRTNITIIEHVVNLLDVIASR